MNCAGGAGSGGTGGDGECGSDNPLRDLHIDPSTQTTQAGSSFTYTISVTNRGECELTDVRVEDTIDGPPGSEVVATDPDADDVDGLTVVWNDIGPLAPGAVKVLTVTVDVPSDADEGDEYSSDVTATATGGGESFEQDASVDGPTVGGAEVAVGGSSLPRTGMYIGTLVAIALALLGGGEFLRRRSGRWSPDLTP